jgi:hypothetical protein
MEVNWGSLAEWVGAIGTTGSVLTAVSLLRHERLSRLQGQARQIILRRSYSREGIEITIENGSTEPFYFVYLNAVPNRLDALRRCDLKRLLTNDGTIADLAGLAPAASLQSTVAPGQYYWDRHSHRVVVSFTDVSGIRWAKELRYDDDESKFIALWRARGIRRRVTRAKERLARRRARQATEQPREPGKA